MKGIRLKLVYQDDSLGEAWLREFEGMRDVSIVKADIVTVDCDAIVSPANSFGFMDGGLDYHLSNYLGWDLQDRLQERIKELPEGELLVGKSLVIETNHAKIPFLISAPTMRVPMSFNIATSVNAYLAMKAILIAAINNEKITTVAIPGLCTGCGKMPVHIASKQMFMAYSEIILGKKQEHKTFGMAQRYQNQLNEKGLIWDF